MHIRQRVRCPVSFVSFDKLRIGETIDLSVGGMKITCRAILLKGESYDFTLVMNGNAINPRGRVVRLETHPEFSYSAGVCFVQLPAGHLEKLSGFLSTEES